VNPDLFLRGNVFPATEAVPYPRARPDARLPADTWSMAQYPVGVRLELVGDAEAVEISYRTETVASHRSGAGSTWSVWRGPRQLVDEPAVFGGGLVRLAIGAPEDAPCTVYLPAGMRPTILDVSPVGGGAIKPAPSRPRWVCYGDSIAAGWVASASGRSWAAIVARAGELDLANLGYAGAARGEIVSAEHVASVPADVISIAYGTNCWTRIPFSVDGMTAGLDAFLRVVRAGQPETPIVVISPVLRPAAEFEPNVLGAGLADLRAAMERTAEAWIAAGEAGIHLIRGGELIEERHLADGVHPNDEGHAIMAEVIGPQLAAARTQR
jgi:lysophospholipase L1-like esterase